MNNRKTRKLSTVFTVYFVAPFIILGAFVLFWTYFSATKVINRAIEKSFDQRNKIVHILIDQEAHKNEDAIFQLLLHDKLRFKISRKSRKQAQKIFTYFVDKIARYKTDIFFISTLASPVWINASAPIPDTTPFLKKIAVNSRKFLDKARIARFRSSGKSLTGIFKSSKILSDSGEVLGIIVTGTVLNDNIQFISQVKKKSQTPAVMLVEEQNVIASSGKNVKLLELDSCFKTFFNQKEQYKIKSVSKHGLLLRQYTLELSGVPSKVKIVFAISDDILKELQTSYIITLVIFFSAFALFLFTALFILRRLINPSMKRLLDFTTQISAGETTVLFQSGLIFELNILGYAMEKMVKSIHLTQMGLRASEENLRITLKSIGDGVITTDIDGNITRMNPMAEILTGWEIEEALGKGLAEVFKLVHASSREVVNNPVNEVLVTGSIVELANHTILVSKDDIEFHIADSAAPILNDLGTMQGVVLVFRDVTELITQNKEKKKLQDMLIHRNKMDAIGQLAGGVAHDFNNMLAGIMGSAQLLQSPKRNLDESSLKFVEIIMTASTRAADLTAKLLAFGRKGKMMSADVDIHEIIEDTVAILEKTIDKRVEISVLINADNSVVVGDATVLQNCFMNLGINASHAMEKSGVLTFETRDIKLDEKYCAASVFKIKAGDYIEISVRDTGTGIEKDLIDKIFEPFFTTKEQGKGTGLGLASVYGTVQDHYGAINVYSEVGVGTVFHIYLPTSFKGSQVLELEKKEEIITGKGKIILIDDEEIIRIIGSQMLEDMGYEVIAFENGFNAIEFFKENFQDILLVITDMIMPRVNGRDLFYMFREIDGNCKVMMSSGFTRDDDLNVLRKDGLAGFICKPFRNAELSEILKKATNDNS